MITIPYARRSPSGRRAMRQRRSRPTGAVTPMLFATNDETPSDRTGNDRHADVFGDERKMAQHARIIAEAVEADHGPGGESHPECDRGGDDEGADSTGRRATRPEAREKACADDRRDSSGGQTRERNGPAAAAKARDGVSAPSIRPAQPATTEMKSRSSASRGRRAAKPTEHCADREQREQRTGDAVGQEGKGHGGDERGRGIRRNGDHGLGSFSASFDLRLLLQVSQPVRVVAVHDVRAGPIEATLEVVQESASRASRFRARQRS